MGIFDFFKSNNPKKEVMWPNLSNIGHIKGRVATEDDVNKGNAVFILESEGQSIGNPIDIELPQYGFMIDEDTKEKTACVIIQAEWADDKKYLGAYDFKTEQFMMGFHSDFVLLGTEVKES